MQIQKMMTEFYNNTVKYYDKIKTLIAVPTSLEAPKSLSENKKNFCAFENLDGIISESKERILLVKNTNPDFRKLKFIILNFEKIHEGNAEFKALMSLADFHLKVGEIEKGAQFLEKIVFSSDLSEELKICHNRIIEETRKVTSKFKV